MNLVAPPIVLISPRAFYKGGLHHEIPRPCCFLTRDCFFYRFWTPMVATRSMSEVSLPAITPSRPRRMANTPTALVTNTGAPTPRRFPSTYTVSSLLANPKCPLILSKPKVRHTISLASPNSHMTIHPPMLTIPPHSQETVRSPRSSQRRAAIHCHP